MTNILDLVHLPVLIKNTVSETELCLRLQAKHTVLRPVDRANPCLWTTVVVLVKACKLSGTVHTCWR